MKKFLLGLIIGLGAPYAYKYGKEFYDEYKDNKEFEEYEKMASVVRDVNRNNASETTGTTESNGNDSVKPEEPKKEETNTSEVFKDMFEK